MGTNAHNDSEDPVGLPDFAVAMRGYDRLQVDEYIARLNRWLEEAQTRTAEAERKLAERPLPAAAPAKITAEPSKLGPMSLDEAGARISALLVNAQSECEKMRADAQQD